MVYFKIHKMKSLYAVRSRCVICGNEDMKPVFQKKNYPITFSPPCEESNPETDITINQTFLVCPDCQCTQLKELINPVILYKNAHNMTMDTPSWSKHHESFANFVGECIKEKAKVMEVGGCSRKILDTCGDKLKSYGSLDLCDPENKISGVNYHLGNCESYNFSDFDTIIMSHVFEHLFEPAKFVCQAAKSGVKNIIVSIPNLKELVKSRSPSVLHNEHTYYVDKKYVETIFAGFGSYRLTKQKDFLKHSLFFNFQLENPGPSCEPFRFINKDSISTQICTSLIEKMTKIQKIEFENENKVAIIPAGHLGQLVYHYLSEEIKEKVLMFCDNDPTKQGKRVYGTHAKTYPFDVLRDRNTNCSNFILFGGVYEEELLAQLKSWADSDDIIVVI